eukprot:3088488-Amphidinium_carterae.1
MGTDANQRKREQHQILVEQRAPQINLWQVGQKTYQRKVSKILRVLNSDRRREREADLENGCSACAGLSYQHSKGCLRFRQNVNEDPAFAPEQVQASRYRGLLQPVGQTTEAGRQTADAGSSGTTAVGSSAVGGTAGEASAGAADSSGAASGPAPEVERSSTTRGADELDEDDQAAHKFIR